MPSRYRMPINYVCDTSSAWNSALVSRGEFLFWLALAARPLDRPTEGVATKRPQTKRSSNQFGQRFLVSRRDRPTDGPGLGGSTEEAAIWFHALQGRIKGVRSLGFIRRKTTDTLFENRSTRTYNIRSAVPKYSFERSLGVKFGSLVKRKAVRTAEWSSRKRALARSLARRGFDRSAASRRRPCCFRRPRAPSVDANKNFIPAGGNRIKPRSDPETVIWSDENSCFFVVYVRNIPVAISACLTDRNLAASSQMNEATSCHCLLPVIPTQRRLSAYLEWTRDAS